MEYRTYHEWLGKSMESSIDAKNSIALIWHQFKSGLIDIRSQLNEDIESYGLAFEYYDGCLHLIFQITNVNSGYRLMEQAWVVVKYTNRLDIGELSLEL
jgi:hypothetical protein